MSYVSDCNKSIKTIINEKMRCLDDFGVCSYSDKEMRDRLKQAIAKYPDKTPQEAIDYYCRPLIYNKVWSY